MKFKSVDESDNATPFGLAGGGQAGHD